jgi:hypothetical protein
MLEPINKILIKRANKYGIKNVADASRICFIAKSVSNNEFEPKSFKNGMLTIIVKNNIIASEIQMNSASIIKKINQKIGSETIKKIKFKIIM